MPTRLLHPPATTPCGCGCSGAQRVDAALAGIGAGGLGFSLPTFGVYQPAFNQNLFPAIPTGPGALPMPTNALSIAPDGTGLFNYQPVVPMGGFAQQYAQESHLDWDGLSDFAKGLLSDWGPFVYCLLYPSRCGGGGMAPVAVRTAAGQTEQQQPAAGGGYQVGGVSGSGGAQKAGLFGGTLGTILGVGVLAGVGVAMFKNRGEDG